MKKVLSMTGFGTARCGVDYTVEIKSVNHRFLEILTRSPNGLESFEPLVQKVVRSVLRRGRVDVSIIKGSSVSSTGEMIFAAEVFQRSFLKLFSSLAGDIPDADTRREIISRLLLERKEILGFEMHSVDQVIDEKMLEQAVQEALDQLVKMRENEGETLVQVLLKYLKEIESFVSDVRPLVVNSIERYRERIADRIKQIDVTVSEERLATEIALMAERTDVSEELERLTSHIKQFRTLLQEGGEIGKKLDFLTQEMLREVNTTGSKSQSAAITQQVVNAKAAIDKLKEQIQNIE